MPGLYRDTRIHRIAPFFQAMRIALQSLAPSRAEVPRIVLLTSGAGSETAFDQAFLSSLLGFPLVEGADLLVRDGHVWQRSIGRLEPVDVIVRRVDADFCDPLELRPDSQLGVPGLIEANRLGNVSIVNGLGSGILENPALFPFLPKLCEVLLDQPLALPSAQTWWCGEELSRQHVIAHLDELVIKPVSRRVVSASRFGWELSSEQRAKLIRRINADPFAWVGQEYVLPSTAPGVGAGLLEPQPVVVRSFAVAEGSSYRILPGGLSRVLPDTGLDVSLRRPGSQAKDVWVLSSSPVLVDEPATPALARGQVVAAISPRVAEALFWLGRYAERAEDVSRLIAVTDNRWHDVHDGVDPAVPECVDILLDAAMSVSSPWPPIDTGLTDPHAMLNSIIGDDGQRSGTVAHDVRRIRELANASRDQLSTDTWAILSDLERGLQPVSYGVNLDIATSMASLREALMAFAGLAAESMVRDSGWHFMDAGRRLERALQVARLLRATFITQYAPEVEALVEESTLVAAESIITHRRRYPAQSGADTVFELLLMDRDNPRSLAFQLDRLASDLRRLAPAGSTDTGLDRRVQHSAARLLAADCRALAGVGADGRRAGLEELLGASVDDLHELATAIAQAHFVQQGRLQPLVPTSDFQSLEAV